MEYTKEEIVEELKSFKGMIEGLDNFDVAKLRWTQVETTMLYSRAVHAGELPGLFCIHCEGPVHSRATIQDLDAEVLWQCHACDILEPAPQDIYDQMRHAIERMIIERVNQY